MAHETGYLADPRMLTREERSLVEWLLEHGDQGAMEFFPQLALAQVVAHCRCGCASIDFAIDGQRPKKFAMRVLSDYQWRDEQGRLFGAMVFEQDDLLAGLDLWSIDGAGIPSTLPAPALLLPYGAPFLCERQTRVLPE